MSKYKINNLEKLAIWNSYGNRCFWCGEPITYDETSIDHVLPERLIDYPDELNRIKINYKLQDDFKINDFCNWVPAHPNCNARKTKSVFVNSPAFIFILHKLYSKSQITKKYYLRIKKRQSKDKIIGQLIANLEQGQLEDSDLIQLLKRIKSKYVLYDLEIDKNKLTYVPEGWKVVDENKNKRFLNVTNGRITATVPTDTEPDMTWFCLNCKNYGPWIGNRCINCGSWGDLVD